MTSEKLIKLGKRAASISFLIGTFIIVSYYFTDNANLLLIGYGFILLAGLVNIILLILIISKAKSDRENRTKLVLTGMVMLLNIPVLVLYIWFSMMLLGNMRITFTNPTEYKITDITIIGCESEYIDELEPNESKTIWVAITGDCSIYVAYLTNGTPKKETVVGYTTPGNGQKMNHNIDGKDGFRL